MNTLLKKSDIQYAVRQTSLGLVQVAQTEEGVCSIVLGDTEDEMMQELQERFPGKRLEHVESDSGGWADVVVRYIESPVGTINVPLAIEGTAFQRDVWEALCAIPAGKTLSYTEVAHHIGRPKAVRAVAGACAGNKIAVVIPCHRVVRSDGSISGYRWGVERKRLLLEREQLQNAHA